MIQIDSLAQGTLAAEKQGPAAEHLAGCEQCRKDLELSRDLRQRFERDVFERSFARMSQRRASRWGWNLRILIPSVALAAVGTISLLLLPSLRSTTAQVLVKGDPVVRVFAHRGDRIFQVSSGESLHAGDELRFQVEPVGLRYLLIGSVDAAGHASIYEPFEGQTSVEVPLDGAYMSEGSVVLDASPGPERVFALFSRKPLSAGPVLRKLEARARGGAASVRVDTRLEVEADAQATFEWEKSTP